ncbi:MAG: glutamate-1-semialdehyde 2,1-aminomutase [Candidatus Bathyarchaeota archaeon]|nr:glutamate-1-semialdehyde 2,1-aminomutase [Candidatus Bathyarchaeota archaeon]MDH5532428.1 glutamate-1-semialdehyde 2,1-aminomutase [Candidatus Bathyarchaeota archaeon]MDH5746153.1 glutamate-1-semialdehyde 2,1-aminomutase [Candidatus Bathyarchaeota archaeon]
MVKDETVKTYTTRTQKSKKLWEEAKEVVPGGIGSAVRYFEPYPFFISKAKGSRVWDVDGNEYLDLIMGYGINIAGHAHPAIVGAVKKQIEKGSVYTMPHEKTALYVKELLKRFPTMSMFQLANSGAEATMHAIRVARAYTGKDKIVKIEGCYHGQHDYLLISVDPPRAKAGPKWAPTRYIQSEGMPKDTVKNTLVAPFNDVAAMESLFKKHEGEIAALIMEPIMLNCGVVLPKKGYLRGIRKLTEEYNILLIFDEVKTGVRVAPGGASELYKIEPDIITLAKAIGGGLPLAAFGGKREIMESLRPIGRTSHGGTYCANPLSISAGLACLTQVMTNKAHRYMTELGNELSKGVRDVIEDVGVTACVNSIGPLGYVFFTDVEPVDYRTADATDLEKTWEFWFNMVNRGVLPWGPCHFEQWYVSVVHTKDEITKTIETSEEALRKVKAN